MAAYIKSIDVYHHPVSTSFCCHDVTQVYSLPVVDFAMTHTYGSYDTSDTANNVQHFVRTQSAEYTKPVYVAECGTAGVYGPTASADPTGISLHNMLWAPVATRGAGTAMSWWWDSWIAPANLYDSFVISNFTRDVTWTAHQWSEVPLAFLDAKNVTRLLATVGAPLGRLVG